MLTDMQRNHLVRCERLLLPQVAVIIASPRGLPNSVPRFRGGFELLPCPSARSGSVSIGAALASGYHYAPDLSGSHSPSLNARSGLQVATRLVEPLGAVGEVHLPLDYFLGDREADGAGTVGGEVECVLERVLAVLAGGEQGGLEAEDGDLE